jgi:DNA-binding NarL/FixJ family response regulator
VLIESLVVQSFTILIVDDFEPFRRWVCSILRGKAEFRVIDEAPDGLQAVQKAEEHQPDLILLDMGLPILNGMMVARRVRKLSPASKIVFLTQESSADVVREGLALGALAYVYKPLAHSDLLPAIEAALRGSQFVSTDMVEAASRKQGTCHYSVDFDRTNRILRCCLKGRITNELMKDFHAGMKEPARRVQPDAGVVDTSTVVSFEVSSEAMRELVAAPPIMPSASARVVIAPSPNVYGLMRMFEREVRGTRPNFHVVRADREAWAILGVPSPQFEPLDTPNPAD